MAACINPGGSGVAQSALAIAAHLQMCRLSTDPGGYTWDKCYDSAIPQGAITYWRAVCPPGSGCWPYWQSGNLQCVELVTAAYSMAGEPLPLAGNAIDFWSLYSAMPGWIEIPVAPRWGTPGLRRGLPEPGDMIVWFNADAPHLGHIAVAVGVAPPTSQQNGTLTFAQANGPAPVAALAIAPDNTVASSPRFYVVGYIRHISATPHH